MNEREKDELLLTQVALMFQTAALQQMGKLRSPVTGTVERDLDQARISIDILDVLHRRMKGNLSPSEEQMFTTLLRDLRLNYVDEASKPAAPAPPAPGPPAPGSTAPGPHDPESPAPDPPAPGSGSSR